MKIDDRDNQSPGYKFAEWELKGVPVRLALGQRDLQNGSAEVARRDTKSKATLPWEGLEQHIIALLDDIQQSLYQKAAERMKASTHRVESYEELKQVLAEKGGFVAAHWDGTPETEEAIKAETKATIRCIPLDNPQEEGRCIYSGKPSKQRVLFALAY